MRQGGWCGSDTCGMSRCDDHEKKINIDQK